MKKLFIINAPEDYKKAEELTKHLTLFKRQGLIEFTTTFNDADIVLLFLSNNFLADERTWNLSLEARRQQQAGRITVVPILVEDIAELPDHLILLQKLPRHGKPAKGDEDWAGISKDLAALIRK